MEDERVSLSPTDCASCLLKSILVSGMLKGYDQLMNLVLDDVKESMRGKSLNDITKLDEVSNSAIQMMKEMKLPAPLVSSSPAAL